MKQKAKHIHVMQTHEHRSSKEQQLRIHFLDLTLCSYPDPFPLKGILFLKLSNSSPFPVKNMRDFFSDLFWGLLLTHILSALIRMHARILCLHVGILRNK